jgi:AraC-like DNA-binding protein
MLAFVPAGEPHATHLRDGVRTFDVVLQPDWERRLRRGAALVDEPAEFRCGLPVWLSARLYQEFQNPDDLTPLVLEGMTLELLAEMSRATATAAARDVPRWLTQARDLLHAHFTENLSLDMVAAAAGVHPAHLTRAFRRHYRETIGDYVRGLRVEYARHLLVATDAPLSQIALDAGFADQAHLSRSFRRRTGMTPGAFRRACGRAGSEQTMLR